MVIHDLSAKYIHFMHECVCAHGNQAILNGKMTEEGFLKPKNRQIVQPTITTNQSGASQHLHHPHPDLMPHPLPQRQQQQESAPPPPLATGGNVEHSNGDSDVTLPSSISSASSPTNGTGGGGSRKKKGRKGKGGGGGGVE